MPLLRIVLDTRKTLTFTDAQFLGICTASQSHLIYNALRFQVCCPFGIVLFVSPFSLWNRRGRPGRLICPTPAQTLLVAGPHIRRITTRMHPIPPSIQERRKGVHGTALAIVAILMGTTWWRRVHQLCSSQFSTTPALHYFPSNQFALLRNLLHSRSVMNRFSRAPHFVHLRSPVQQRNYHLKRMKQKSSCLVRRKKLIHWG